MLRASSAHLQDDTVVYMQHMVLSFSMRVPGGLSVHRCVPTGQLKYIVAVNLFYFNNYNFSKLK